MLQASTRALLIGPIIAGSVILAGCSAATEPASGTGTVTSVAPRAAAPVAAPGEAVAAGSAAVSDLRAAVDPATLPAGALYRNPANGRDEVMVGNIAHTALLIGDSQSEPQASWPRRALAGLGYDVFFCGKGGTGFVAGNSTTGNYIDALENGDWHLPYGSPPLVIIEGGGNDASRGAPDEAIEVNAERLIEAVEDRYPHAEVVMVGTLARGANAGGGRRTQVDSLLGAVAKEYGLSFVSVGDWLTRYGLEAQLSDSVHMNGDGHRALGALLGDRLANLGLALS
jgi:acyl-CoA thioesterase-1